ncbi:hypothetical protein IFHNHDMJ_01939 [Synechococcus sp. CBW1107]|nr:hypothetical protein IFHNHDMJ_01939 [Synechococcus sp. CBW1107]
MRIGTTDPTTAGWTKTALVCLAACITTGWSLPARADARAVVPENERRGLEHVLPGAPKETRGVRSVRLLGSTDLEQDFPAMKGYVLRAREITVAPRRPDRRASP